MATRRQHGHTPAAWTAVFITTAGFFVGAFGVILLVWPLFWFGVALIVAGPVVGKVMQMMGLGKEAEVPVQAPDSPQ